MVVSHYPSLSFVSLNMQISLASFETGSNISLTWDEANDIVGIYEDCVIGVDLARGVTILVVPGKVFA